MNNLGYVPNDWLTAELDHTIRSWKTGFFRRTLTCTCGLSARHPRDMWQRHWASELEIRQWTEQIQQKKSARLRALIEKEKAENIAAGRFVPKSKSMAGPTNDDSDTLADYDF